MTAKTTTTKAAKKPASLAAAVLKQHLAGRTNKQIFANLQLTRGLRDDQAYYVAWYIAYARRQGKLAPKMAAGEYGPPMPVAAEPEAATA